ncbi:hypothetical protein [Actinacidiphila sp. bgisy167]|uniref:hypothetical protein n=1 Tax=Actinacidiphila sp. bgisy167 TaxID=3413797 RepID=UPI003D731175
MSTAVKTCDQHRPGYEHGGTGRGYLRCALPADHEGHHQNIFRDTWSGYLPIIDAEPARDMTRRLLPWGGKPAYVSAGGAIARIADRIEAVQLNTAAELLTHARLMLADDEPLTPEQSRFVVMRLSEALSDTLRVAQSRGMRLPGGGHDAE